MPAIPGLIALMAMTFAPKMELRVDNRQSRYTGVICGLGVDPTRKTPVYPEHDMEILFDTEITNNDILDVSYFS